jgi:hypothetical protein
MIAFLGFADMENAAWKIACWNWYEILLLALFTTLTAYCHEPVKRFCAATMALLFLSREIWQVISIITGLDINYTKAILILFLIMEAGFVTILCWTYLKNRK